MSGIQQHSTGVTHGRHDNHGPSTRSMWQVSTKTACHNKCQSGSAPRPPRERPKCHYHERHSIHPPPTAWFGCAATKCRGLDCAAPRCKEFGERSPPKSIRRTMKTKMSSALHAIRRFWSFPPLTRPQDEDRTWESVSQNKKHEHKSVSECICSIIVAFKTS